MKAAEIEIRRMSIIENISCDTIDIRIAASVPPKSDHFEARETIQSCITIHEHGWSALNHRPIDHLEHVLMKAAEIEIRRMLIIEKYCKISVVRP